MYELDHNISIVYTYIDARSFALRKKSSFVLYNKSPPVINSNQRLITLSQLPVVAQRQNTYIGSVQYTRTVDKPDERELSSGLSMLTSEKQDDILQKPHPHTFCPTSLLS